MKFTISCAKLIALAAFLAVPFSVQGATVPFGPTPYLQAGGADTPAGFFNFSDPGFKTAWIENFEPDQGPGSTDPVDDFLTISPGAVLLPNSFSGAGSSVTDSVDGDDGSVDGSGTNGHSWFTGEGTNEVTVTFERGVRAAGLVFTDGDPNSTKITLEAFDTMGGSLALIDAGDLAGPFFTGQTAEDRFLGFTDEMTEIGSIKLVMTGGSGIEIDHVHWQEPAMVPEPSAQFMAMFALLGLIGLRRGRNS